MKKIQLVAKDWGPHYLLALDGRQCCLGQASLQLGLPRDAIKGISMPGAVEQTRANQSGDFLAFQSACEKIAPSDYRMRIEHNQTDVAEAPGPSLGKCLASINDDWFEGKMSCSREKVIELLTEGFKLMGYELEFIPMEKV